MEKSWNVVEDAVFGLSCAIRKLTIVKLPGQIMRFAREHPTEMLILKFSMDGMDTDQEKRAWAQTAWNLLGKRMIKARKHDEPQVKYHEAVENNKNIIFGPFSQSQTSPYRPFGKLWS